MAPPHEVEGLGVVDRWFRITERGSSVSTEIRAGIVTFLTMSYILLVNPQILSKAGMPLGEVCTATALTSALASLLVGLFANLPVGIAPGMGLNAYFVFSQVVTLKVTLERALAGCLVAAVLVGLLAVVGALALVLALVPNSIKLATVVGMGLLLSLIGMQQSNVVVASAETMVGLGNLLDPTAILAIVGLALIATLHYRNVKGSILLGIAGVSIAFWCLNADKRPTEVVALPLFRSYRPDFTQLLERDAGAWSAVCAYSLVMIFDIGGALYGLGNLAGLVKDNVVPGAVMTYLAAAAGTLLGAFTGTTPLIIAAESAVGIKEGGRTGLVAVTISACFMVSLFLAPLLQAVPAAATAPVLVLVGTMMMGESVHIDWSTMPSAVPAFLCMVVQPFSFSIANGIYAGLLFSLLLFILTGDFIPYFRNLMYPPLSDEDECLEIEAPLLPEVEGHAGEKAGKHSAPQHVDIPHPRARTAASPISSLVRGVSRNIGSYMEHPYEIRPSSLLINPSGLDPLSSGTPPSASYVARWRAPE